MRRLLLLAPLLLADCTVGPDFAKPDAKLPANWYDHSTAPSGLANTDPNPKWWESFNDPILTKLVERAVENNQNVQEAVLRIAEARAGEMSAAAAGLPHVNGDAKYTREQLGLRGIVDEHAGSLGGAEGKAAQSSQVQSILSQLYQPIDLYQAALDASWEIDLFGKVRRSVESANAQTDQAIANRDDALITVEAEVAQTYARLRAAEAGHDTAVEDLNAERDVVALTIDRAKVGLVSRLDVSSAEAQLQSTQAQLPQFEAQIASSKDALCVLVGSPPGSLDDVLATAAPIPPLPKEVPVGLPATLARRRPDIRMAEAKLHQQTAEVGVAIASLFPDVSLSASVGQRAQKIGDLSHWANNFYSFGPDISLPIFQGGSLVANIRLNKAEQAEAAVDYTKTVISALSEINDAMVSYRTEQDRRVSLEASLAADRDALDYARDRYLHGLSNFIDVLTAETNLDQARQNVITSTATEATDLVQLYKALGGGWEPESDKPKAPEPDKTDTSWFDPK